MGLRRFQVVAVVTAVVLALGYLVYSGMQGTMVYYYTVSEVVDGGNDFVDRPVRVAGKVVPGTIDVSTTNHLDRRFVIHEGGREIPVEYHGVAPDTLVDDADAVVEGTFKPDGTFEATFVMAKCPSKYEGEIDYEKIREASGVPAGATSP